MFYPLNYGSGLEAHNVNLPEVQVISEISVMHKVIAINLGIYVNFEQASARHGRFFQETL